jgi:myo-inositol-1(or 4)-monophosphatase
MPILTELISILKHHLPTVLDLRTQKTKKDDDSYVSPGDLWMDKIIMAFLREKCASVQILTEETYVTGTIDVHAAEWLAIVDPIDGTENFVSGLKEWGTGICLFKNGQFAEALIGLPELDLYLHSDHIPERRFDSRIYGISSSLTKEEILNLETGFEYRMIGCCMYNMHSVLTGAFKQFQNPKGAKCWDILPGLQMALKQNCIVEVNNEPYDGSFLQPDRKYRFRITNP